MESKSPFVDVVRFALCVISAYVASVVPVVMVIIASGPLQLEHTVWTVAVVLLLAAIANEWFGTGSARLWLRALAWGLACGAIGNLVYLISIEWKIDLTL